MRPAPDASGAPAPSQPFQDWQKATAALRSAQARGSSEGEISQLSAEVIRTRNALTMDRVRAGWKPPDDILEHLLAGDRQR